MTSILRQKRARYTAPDESDTRPLDELIDPRCVLAAAQIFLLISGRRYRAWGHLWLSPVVRDQLKKKINIMMTGHSPVSSTGTLDVIRA